MKSEPKYRKQLDRNGWRARLQRWMWGDSTPSFSGYCPFFWFTWLTLLLSPFGLVFFTIRGFFRMLGSGLRQAMPIPRPPDSHLLQFWDDVQNIGYAAALGHWEGFTLVDWVRATPCWKDYVEEIFKKRERRAAKAPIPAARVKRASSIAKPIMFTILGGLALIVAWFLGKGLWHVLGLIWANFTLLGLWTFIKAAAVICVGAGLLYGLFMGIGKLWSLRPRCPKDPNHIPWWAKVGGVLFTGIEFLFETVESVYTSECPLIEWADESKPIRRAK